MLRRIQPLNHAIFIVERIGIASVRVDQQRSVRTLDHLAYRAGRTAKGNAGDMSAIRALNVRDAVGAVGVAAALTCQDIAVRDQRAILAHGIDIRDRGGVIIQYGDDQRVAGLVAIDISDGDRETVGHIVAAAVMGQRVAIVDTPFADRGDHQDTLVSLDRLPGLRDQDVVDRHGRRGVGRRVGDRACGGFDIGRRVRARRRSDAGIQPGLAHNRSLACTRHGKDRDIAVGDVDPQRRDAEVTVAVA